MGLTTTKTKSTRRFQTATELKTSFTRYVAGGPLVPVTQSSMRSVNPINSELIITSKSTKPWLTGKPTEWTPHQRSYRLETPVEGVLTSKAFHNDFGWYNSLTVTGSFTAYIGGGSQTPLINPSLPPSSALNSKLRGKLKSEFNAAVALAEVSKSVDTVTSRVVKIGKAMLAIKSGKVSRALSILGNPKLKKLNYRDLREVRRLHRTKREREIAQAWLEMQYGWAPLISDVYNAIEHAKKPSSPPVILVRAGVRENFNRVIKSIYTNTPFGVNFDVQHTISGHTVRRYVIEYTIPNTYLNHVSSVSLLNPLSVVWELVPFSFVVDWFLPVGKWIDGLDATIGCTFLRGCETTQTKLKQVTVYTTPKVVTSVSGRFSGSLETDAKSRQGMISFPGIGSPTLKNPVSTTHAQNALALLVAIFHK